MIQIKNSIMKATAELIYSPQCEENDFKCTDAIGEAVSEYCKRKKFEEKGCVYDVFEIIFEQVHESVSITHKEYNNGIKNWSERLELRLQGILLV